MRSTVSSLILVVAVMTQTALAETPHSIVQKMQQMQLERWEDVNSYVVSQSIMNQPVTLVFERTEVMGADGKMYPTFQRVESGAGKDPTTQAFLENYGDAAEKVGDGLSTEMENGLEQAGLPRGLFKSMGGDPWVSPDPRTMMGGLAQASRLMAAGSGAERSDPAADAAASIDGMAAFTERARLLGTEEVAGRPAFHLVAEDVNQVQRADGQEFRLDTAHMWIDTREYVLLKMQIDGVASAGKESRPMTIETVRSDYRTVPGSRMYEPYRQVMRMSGVMTPEQQAELQQSQKKLAEVEQKVAAMPAGQRDMAMAQMGPQMAMLKKMAAGGGMEMVTDVRQILVNPDAAALQGLNGTPMTAPNGNTAMPVAAAAVPAAATASPAAAESAQQACLREKMAEAKKKQQNKRGLGNLLNAASRLAGRFGGADVNQAMGDVSTANATATDLTAAARDLGLTEDEIAACENAG